MYEGIREKIWGVAEKTGTSALTKQPLVVLKMVNEK
jgi:hypothetical protein